MFFPCHINIYVSQKGIIRPPCERLIAVVEVFGDFCQGYLVGYVKNSFKKILYEELKSVYEWK